MKKVLPFILALGFSSCEKVVEENLYNKYDKDWDLVQARIKEKCEGSTIFKELQKRSSFDSYYGEAYFQVKVSNNDNITDYIKIYDINSTQLTIAYYSDLSPVSGSAKVTFTSSQNNSLIEAIKNGVCATDEDDEFGHGSLDSLSNFYFTYARGDDGTNDYKKRVDRYDVDNLPLPLILWNRTETTTDIKDGKETNKEEVKYTISSLSSSACNSDDHPDCRDADWTSFGAGTITIDETAYSSNDINARVVEFTN